MNIDKQNGDVCFSEKEHIYFEPQNPSVKYISATTLIHEFTQPFDKELKSAIAAIKKLLDPEILKVERKALNGITKFDKSILAAYNISENDFNREQQAILDEWDRINRESCERGTKIHSQIENSFYKDGKNIKLDKFGLGGKFECKKDYCTLDLPHGVYPEYLIHYKDKDNILNIAGQIDLLVKDGNDITIIDHKGLDLNTPILTKNSGFKTMEELKIGDTIFDKDGKETRVLEKSEIHYNPCFKIYFDTGDVLTADEDHKWIIYNPYNKTEKIFSTLDLYSSFNNESYKHNRTLQIDLIPRIDFKEKDLPIDPFVIGMWFATYSFDSLNPYIKRIRNNVAEEFEKRGYKLTNISKWIYNCDNLLSDLNKYCGRSDKFPIIYLYSSYKQRLEVLKGILFAKAFNDKSMTCNTMYIPGARLYVYSYLFNSLGIPYTCSKYPNYFNTYRFRFTVNANIDNENLLKERKKIGRRKIIKIERCDMIPTQCIVVDSPSHSYLAGYGLIITHNSNKEIKMNGYFNAGTRQTQKMQYPLNNLDDANFNHYQLQLSLYAWMLQQINPDFNIVRLIINHYDHKDHNTLYDCEYLKKDIENMLNYKKKMLIRAKQKERRTPFVY